MTEDPIAAQLVEAMRTVFKQPAVQFKPDQNLRDFFGFDSVQFISLILTLEERFGVAFNEEEVDSIYVVGDIYNLLRDKTADAHAA